MKLLAPWFRSAGEALRAWARPMEEPLFAPAIAAIAGILLADRWPGAGWAGVVGAGLWLAWKGRRRWGLLLGVAGAFALLHSGQRGDPLRAETARTMAPGGGVTAQVTGVVTDAPVRGFSGDSWRFPLRVRTLSSQGTAWPGAGRLLYVRLTDSPSGPAYGDVVSLTGMLRRSDALRNPGEFDFDSYLKRQGYAAEFAADGAAGRWQRLERGAGNPVMAAALRAREWIGEAVTRDLEDAPDIAATVRCMVLGTQEKTPDDITDAFRASGTMHIFSVSGLHVALFAAILWFILSRTPLPRGWIIGLSLAVMIFYVFITGLRPSAWRAALMVSLFLLAPLWNRESQLFNTLAASALVLLACWTQQLWQAGFVLSFGVLLAIALFQAPLRGLASRVLGQWNAPDPLLPQELHTAPQKAWYWLREKLCESLAVSTASTVGSMPLMIGYFNLITPVGIIANLLLVTLSLWILVVACLSLASAAAGWKPLVLLWNNANWALAWASIGTAKFFAALPFGHVRLDPARLWRGSPCEVTVLALDYGGGAARIDTPAGRQWLIDCGGLRHWNRTVRPHLERAPVNRLEGLFLTHSDSFHSGALAPLSQLFPPEQIWSGRHPTTAPELALHSGTSFSLDDGVRLEVLFPPASWSAREADNRAVVLRLEHRGSRILFMSDAGFLTEKALLASGQDLRADLLVMGRHGTDFCGLPEFLRAVRPGALVCTNSRFPESERAPVSWQERAAAQGITVFDQARTGAVTLRIDEAGITARAFCQPLTWSAPARPAPPWSVPPEKPGPLIR